MTSGFFARPAAWFTARAKGSALSTIPGPPPYGRSSTLRCRSCVKSRGFIARTSRRPLARARFNIDSPEYAPTISGNRVRMENVVIPCRLRSRAASFPAPSVVSEECCRSLPADRRPRLRGEASGLPKISAGPAPGEKTRLDSTTRQARLMGEARPGGAAPPDPTAGQAGPPRPGRVEAGPPCPAGGGACRTGGETAADVFYDPRSPEGMRERLFAAMHDPLERRRFLHPFLGDALLHRAPRRAVTRTRVLNEHFAMRRLGRRQGRQGLRRERMGGDAVDHKLDVDVVFGQIYKIVQHEFRLELLFEELRVLRAHATWPQAEAAR